MATARRARALARSAVLVAITARGAFTLVAAPACGGGTSDPAADGGARTDVGTVVVGVTTGLRAGTDFDRLHVLAKSGGATLRDEVLPTATRPLALPLELPFTDRPAGEVVDVTLTATSTAVKGLSIVREASTRVVGGRSLLLRTSLDAACVAIDAPGGTQPPACAVGETCAEGKCAKIATDPTGLEAYSPTWAAGGAPDRCRPVGAGAPEVIVGQGQADFLPFDDCSAPSPKPAQVEAGPQGGHHVWVAVRMRNLHQSGSVTTVRGHFPDLPKDPWDMAVIFTFEPDEGGYCKVYGIRYQLDTNGLALADVLGKKLELTIEVKDADGTTGVGKRCVLLSSESL